MKEKFLLPATILIVSVILGGFFYASQVNKERSIERRQLIDLQTKAEAERAAQEAQQIVDAIVDAEEEKPNVSSGSAMPSTQLEVTSSTPISMEKPRSEAWNKSPKIISISDNLGNNFDMACEGTMGCLHCYRKNGGNLSVSAKSTSEIRIAVTARDPNNRPVYFRFYSSDCGKDWGGDSFCSYPIQTDKLGQVSFAVMIKNDDNFNNDDGDCDAYSMIDYELTE